MGDLAHVKSVHIKKKIIVKTVVNHVRKIKNVAVGLATLQQEYVKMLARILVDRVAMIISVAVDLAHVKSVHINKKMIVKTLVYHVTKMKNVAVVLATLQQEYVERLARILVDHVAMIISVAVDLAHVKDRSIKKRNVDNEIAGFRVNSILNPVCLSMNNNIEYLLFLKSLL